MRIVHLADSHLGFSSYSHLDQHGLNRMEEKVYSGFEKAIERILQIRPDAVVHAGDVFHHVRPKIKPLFVFQRALRRLQEAGVPLVVISGNHDSPKSYSQLSPFRLFEGLDGVHIAHRYKYERYDLGEYRFHCIPYCLEPQDYLEEARRIERSGHDVLVMHGLVEALRSRRTRSVGEHELSDSLLKGDFDYIALGHLHAQTQISGNAWYSGSVDYFNFGEAGERKGMLLVDLEARRADHIDVAEKYMEDLLVDCSGLSSKEIMERLAEICQEEMIRDRMVRVTLSGVDRSAYRSIDQSRLRRMGASAIYLKIRPEFQDEERVVGRPVDRPRLHEEFGAFLRESGERIPAAIRDEVVEYGSEVMRRAVAAGMAWDDVPQ